MKSLGELFELVAMAVSKNQTLTEDWFIDYHGHVNQLSIRYYQCGWKEDYTPESVEFKLNEDGIQGAYWFIKTRL
jgi:hypothetical protein